MNAVDERIERALAAIAESPGWDDDVAAARARVDARAGRSVTTRRHGAWLAAAAAAIVAAGAAGVWLTRSGGSEPPAGPGPTPQTTALAPVAPPGSSPESSPAPTSSSVTTATTTTPTSSPTSSAAPDDTAPTAPGQPPGAPAFLAVADPTLGLGRPSRFDPWTASAHGTDTTGVMRTFVRRDGHGDPVGSIQVQRWQATDFGTSWADSEPVDLGAGIDARIMRFQAVEGGQLAWKADGAMAAVLWRGDVTDAGTIDVARQVTRGGPGAAAPPGFEEVASPVTTASVDYESGVSVTTFGDEPGAPLDAQALAFAEFGVATPAGDGVWDATAPASGGTTAVVAIDDATVAAVYVPGGVDVGVDAVTVAASLHVEPAAEIPVDIADGGVPADAEVAS